MGGARFDAAIVDAKLLTTVMDNVGAFIYIKDILGRYLYANKRVLSLFDVSLANLVGSVDSDLFDLKQSNQLQENDFRVMRYGETIEQEEKNVLIKTSEIRFYWSVKKPLYGENGEIIGMFGISTDITERKLIEEKVNEQNQLLNTILENVDAHIYLKDSEQYLRYVNRKTADLVGRPVEDIVGQKDVDVFGTQVADAMHINDQIVFSTGERQTAREMVRTESGEERHYWSIKVPLDTQGNIKTLIGFSTDITELYQLQEKLRLESIKDSLTALFNRRFLFKAAEKELATASRKRRSTGLLIIDIDHFKEVNDAYGHPQGDKVLFQVGQILERNVRKGDTLARVGGEEFALLMPDTSFGEAESLAERIRESVGASAIRLENGSDLQVTLSIGVAVDSESQLPLEKFYAEADRLLYIAKNLGRNQVCSIKHSDGALIR